MAEINQNESALPLRGKRRAKRHPAHIDMTPMVDLACLLLTFFILTTAFVKPKVMEIVMPSKGEPLPIPERRVITFLLAENNQVFFYNGKADPTSGTLPLMVKSNFTENGIRKVLLQRNKILYKQICNYTDSVTRELGPYTHSVSKEPMRKHIRDMRTQDKTGPIVLIKAGEGIKYGDMVKILDEMAITSIARYAVVDMNYIDKKMLRDALAHKNVSMQD